MCVHVCGVCGVCACVCVCMCDLLTIPHPSLAVKLFSPTSFIWNTQQTKHLDALSRLHSKQCNHPLDQSAECKTMSLYHRASAWLHWVCVHITMSLHIEHSLPGDIRNTMHNQKPGTLEGTRAYTLH